MTGQYFRGDKATFYVTFLSADGSDSPTVINPKITIKHYDSDTSSTVTDINLADMSQIDSTNQYYYEYNVPSDAYFGTYIVIYNATVDGSALETSEEFQIVSTGMPGATGGTPPSGTRIAQIKAKYGLGYSDSVVSYALLLARKFMTDNIFENVEQIINQKATTFKLCNYVMDSNFDYTVDEDDIDVIEYMDNEPYTINDLNSNISSVTLNHPAGFSLLTMDGEYPSSGDYKLKISYLRGSNSYDKNEDNILRVEELLTIYYIFGTVEISALQRGLPNRSINDVTIQFDQRGIADYRKSLMTEINNLKAALIPFEACEYNYNSNSPIFRSVLINKGY